MDELDGFQELLPCHLVNPHVRRFRVETEENNLSDSDITAIAAFFPNITRIELLITPEYNASFRVGMLHPNCSFQCWNPSSHYWTEHNVILNFEQFKDAALRFVSVPGEFALEQKMRMSFYRRKEFQV